MPKNPADVVVRARLKERIHFPDLSERMALKLSAVVHYCARVHFGVWHKKIGSPDFSRFDGVFTPLVYVEIEATDIPLDPMQPLHVHGESFLARSVDAAGATRHLVRQGRHSLFDPAGNLVGRAHLLNVFTRYDADPARRRVTELPPSLGIGRVPSRLAEVPGVESLVPDGRAPDFSDPEPRYWHYGQTDANRHVNGIEYLRAMEDFVAHALGSRGHALEALHAARARIVYRKPCFRGEAYRRSGWFLSETTPVVTGVFRKGGDSPASRAAVAVELTLARA